MKYENVVEKKNIFTNIKGMSDEEAVRSVGKFLMHGRFWLLTTPLECFWWKSRII